MSQEILSVLCRPTFKIDSNSRIEGNIFNQIMCKSILNEFIIHNSELIKLLLFFFIQKKCSSKMCMFTVLYVNDPGSMTITLGHLINSSLHISSRTQSSRLPMWLPSDTAPLGRQNTPFFPPPGGVLPETEPSLANCRWKSVVGSLHGESVHVH